MGTTAAAGLTMMLHSVTNYELHKSLYSGFNDHNFFGNCPQRKTAGGHRTPVYTLWTIATGIGVATSLNSREHLFPIYICLFKLRPEFHPSITAANGALRGKRATKLSDEALRPAISIEQEGELHCELKDLIAQLGQSSQPAGAASHGPLPGTAADQPPVCLFARHGEDSVTSPAVNK